MAYPSPEEYAIALQVPKTAFLDSELQRGSIPFTGLGLPVVYSGGFALTYPVTVAGKEYAARCFHRESKALEQRYQAIDARLQALRSSYFLDFKFLPQGVRAGGKTAPLVKMAWASGETLGIFLGKNYRNTGVLQNLATSLRNLAIFLENNSIAHGDIQLGNLMVADAGRSIQLIDYDGMYVDALQTLGNSEFGIAHFQHPQRKNAWNARLDRFSFIVLHLALKALEAYPELWDQTYSGGEQWAVLKANDFTSPDTSSVLQKLLASPQLSVLAQLFVKLCQSSFDAIPPLEGFLIAHNIRDLPVTAPAQKPKSYIGAYPVLDAANYAMCLKQAGRQVELIGRIVEMETGWSWNRRKTPYVFINFGSWKEEITKLSIWAEGLKTFSTPPDKNWIGKWVTATGFLELYPNPQARYTHLSISVLHANQVHILPEDEALYRLGAAPPSATRPFLNNNVDGLKNIFEQNIGDAHTLTQLAEELERRGTNSAWVLKMRVELAIQDLQKKSSTSLTFPQPMVTPRAPQKSAVPNHTTKIIQDQPQGAGKTAFEDLRVRAEWRDAEAQFELARMYHEGRGVSKDYHQAMQWYWKAAEQGLAKAQFALGRMYEHGLGASPDYTHAAEWYRKAAVQGFADAQYALGLMYEKGLCT